MNHPAPSLLLNQTTPPTSVPQTLQKALKLYQMVYMPSRNFSAKTRVNYGDDLKDLIAFLEQNGKTRLDQVSVRDLQGYMAELDRRGYAGTSRRRKTYSIRSFFRFLYDSGYLAEDIAKRLIPPHTEHKEPRVLSKAEYTALLRACAHHPRDSAIIEVLLQTGLRLSEVARPRLDDVELPGRISPSPDTVGRLHILGKGRKDRWIPLNYKACRALKTWLKARPDVDHDGLFVTKFREPMGVRAIQHVVKKYLKEAGVKGASVHTLRHSFATHHVAQGTSLRTVQEMLGHADLKTTSIYVQLAQEVIRKEVQEHAL